MAGVFGAPVALHGLEQPDGSCSISLGGRGFWIQLGWYTRLRAAMTMGRGVWSSGPLSGHPGDLMLRRCCSGGQHRCRQAGFGSSRRVACARTTGTLVVVHCEGFNSHFLVVCCWRGARQGWLCPSRPFCANKLRTGAPSDLVLVVRQSVCHGSGVGRKA